MFPGAMSSLPRIVLILYFLIVQKMVVASVWSWILNEPFPRSDSLLDHSSQSNKSADASESAATDRADVDTTERFKIELMSPCRNDKGCGRGRFCDNFYGRCERLRKRGEFCRKDDHCQRKHECIFGRCRKEIPRGQEGGKCSADSECSPHHCCARQHGDLICKPRLKHLAKCFVPAGGLDYSLNEQCPCESNLICQYEPPRSSGSATTEKTQKHEWFQFSSDTAQMRCLPVQFSENGDLHDDSSDSQSS